jgi:hypothetical protein
MIKVILLFLLVLTAASSISAQELNSRRINNPDVKYVPNAEVEKNPIPALVFERGGLASEAERKEIIEKIVYPLINTTKQPIAAVIVEFRKDEKDKILLRVILREGVTVGVVIKKNKDGKFDDDAYKIFPDEEDGCDHGESEPIR